MGKINFDTVLHTLDGREMTEREPYTPQELEMAERKALVLPDIKPATLRFICGQALSVDVEGEAAPTPAAKWQTFLVMNAIKDGGQVTLAADDVAFLKARIGKVYTAAVVMAQAWNLLEGRERFSTKPHTTA